MIENLPELRNDGINTLELAKFMTRYIKNDDKEAVLLAIASHCDDSAIIDVFLQNVGYDLYEETLICILREAINVINLPALVALMRVYGSRPGIADSTLCDVCNGWLKRGNGDASKLAEFLITECDADVNNIPFDCGDENIELMAVLLKHGHTLTWDEINNLISAW